MDVKTFAQDHISQITATAGLVTYALARKKLTTGGIFAGIFVAIIHMIHPWPAFFWLLILFFLFGTFVTKVSSPAIIDFTVLLIIWDTLHPFPTWLAALPSWFTLADERQIGHKAKSHLTQSSTGGSGGEGARSSAQVFANTGTACILILTHAYLLSSTPFISSKLPISAGLYSPALISLLPIGIIAQYAAVASDTFSSELGILAEGEPFLITAPWQQVPRGTNGGVTFDGLVYGALGSSLLTIVAILALYLAPPRLVMNPSTAILITVMGLFGSVIDSILGAIVQVTVTDKGSGKVVEGHGGTRVKVVAGGSRVQTGLDLLTNNGVNFAMAAITSLLTMGVAHALALGSK